MSPRKGNRTFFLDRSSQVYTRSRSLPAEVMPERERPLQTRTRAERNARPSSDEESYRQFARCLCREEEARARHRNLFYKQNPHALENGMLGEMFELAVDVETDSKTCDVAKDLEDFSRPLSEGETADLTPMERFLTIMPAEEPHPVEATALLRALGLSEADEQSAYVRVMAAQSLAAEIDLRTRTPATRRRAGEGNQLDSLNCVGNERSWLDLDDSKKSYCGDSPVRKTKSE